VVGKWDAVDSSPTATSRRRHFCRHAAKFAGRSPKSRFEITDIAYTHEFENSVEAKVIAQQKAIEEQNHTKQIEEQARQKVLSAEAEASRCRSAQSARAECQARGMEAVQKWNGVLPQYMLGGHPLINLTLARTEGGLSDPLAGVDLRLRWRAHRQRIRAPRPV
jgi:hypothetical protein